MNVSKSKLAVITLLVGFLYTITQACPSNSMPIQKDITQLPQQYIDYVSSRSEDQVFPLVEGDDGFSPISDSINYLVLPAELANNQSIASLATYYNLTLGVKTLVYDLDTYNRFGFEEEKPDAELLTSYKKAFANMCVTGISDAQLRNDLKALATHVSQVIAQGDDPLQVHFDENDKIQQYYDTLASTLFKQYKATPYDTASVLKDYATLHKRAKTDSLYFDELKKAVVDEQNFEKKTILAKQLALNDYRFSTDTTYAVIAITHHLLTSGNYSPMLYDLWLVWRSSLQVSYLSGMSRDSAIYNVLYNKMKNEIALTLLKHIASHPDDSVAFGTFVMLCEESPIMRSNQFPMGNSAALDQLNLYYDEDDLQ